MKRVRSPSYPNLSLPKALELVSNIFQQDRRNSIDRLTAAKHLGYSSNSGASDKTLATMVQYGLLEKAGVGEVEVTDLAVEILHPESETARKRAIREAATKPAVFSQILEKFSDHTPSTSALQSWLVREEFQNRAIVPITRAFLDTMRFLEQEEANSVSNKGEELAENSHFDDQGGNLEPVIDDQDQRVKATLTYEPSFAQSAVKEWFRVQVGKERTLTINLIGSGEIEPKDIDKLIKMLEVQKMALED